MKFEHAQNTLKYKVGDVVVLAENVEQNRNKTFIPGVAVKIDQLCDFNSNDEHYTVSLVSDPSDYWYIKDTEINHETTALLQMSNESGYLVQKISVENDVVSSAVNTPDNEPKAQDNSWYENGELPPVGANIEYKLGAGPWYEATVKYVLDVLDGGEDEIVIACPHLGFEQLLVLDKHTKIRPIQTPEQIAAQQRKKVIDAISDVLIETERMSSYTDVAAHLYDAGLRFVEEE